MVLKILLLILFLQPYFISLKGQSNISIDSLYKQLLVDNPDTTIFRIYLDIEEYYRATSSDSSLKYLQLALDLSQEKELKKQQSISLNRLGRAYRQKGSYGAALEKYSSSLVLDKEMSDKKGISINHNNLGLVHFDLGNFSAAMEHLKKALALKKEINDSIGIAACYSNIGIVYRNQGHYDKAAEMYLEALRILEKKDDQKGLAKCYNNIGSIFHSHGEFDNALEYYYRSLGISNAINDRRGRSRAYNNIGIIYRLKGNNNEALDFFQKSLSDFEEIGDSQRVSSSLNNIGITLAMKGMLHEAIAQFEQSLSIRETLGDKRGISSTCNSLAETYNLLAEGSKGQNRNLHLSNARRFGQRAYEISTEIGALPMVKQAAVNLRHTLEMLGYYKDALKFANRVIEINDSLFNQEKTKVIAEMQVKYESEQKQQEIQRQQLIIDKNNISYHRQRNQFQYLLAGSILLVLFVALILLAYRQKHKSNIVISEKNELLEQYNEEIIVTTETLANQNETLRKQNVEITKQHSEIEKQRNELANLAWELQETNLQVESQKSQLSAKNKEITDSIIYAQRIQSAVNPSIDTLKPYFSDYYILRKPKSIVSGDFYWATQVKEWLVFCVADCTGHGVPGALMSMLGIAFLNEIVRKDEVTDASIVLNELRQYIIKSMHKPNEHFVSYEGMDIGLCVYNIETKKLQFSGANIPCLIIPHSAPSPCNKIDIVELLPNKMPIGYFDNIKPFDFVEYQISKGDRIYICTDGYADQIGGKSNKKIQGKGLKKLICNSTHLTLDEQNKYLHNYFLDWQGERRQIDDVTILCIKA